MKLIVVCEALADFQFASCLVERVLREEGPKSFRDRPGIVVFRGWDESEEPPFALWLNLDAVYERRVGRRLTGRRKNPYAKAATKAVLVGAQEQGLEGLIMMVDIDSQPDRKLGLEEGRSSASGLRFRVLIATPDPKREAWVLHGFDAVNAKEKKRLESLAKKLGFDPRFEPHRLRGDVRRAETDRDIKQVLDHLTDGDRERESRCCEDTDLAVLEQRGEVTHLGPFLREIRERLLPPQSGRS